MFYKSITDKPFVILYESRTDQPLDIGNTQIRDTQIRDTQIRDTQIRDTQIRDTQIRDTRKKQEKIE
jgi:hypothetical protein